MLKETLLATGLLGSPEFVRACMQTVATGVSVCVCACVQTEAAGVKLLCKMLALSARCPFHAQRDMFGYSLLGSPESVCVWMQTVATGVKFLQKMQAEAMQGTLDALQVCPHPGPF